MAGYNYAKNMSNNACDDIADNILMRKDAIVFLVNNFSMSKKEAEFLLDWSDNTTWHHVGSRYRKVLFYDFSFAKTSPWIIEDLKIEAKANFDRELEKARFFYSDFRKKDEMSEKDYVSLFLKKVVQAKRIPFKKFDIFDFL